MRGWIEVMMRVDGESAEAAADVLQRYGHQGISIEQDGIQPDVWDEGEAPPPPNLTLRAYLPDDERLAASKKQLENDLRHMNRIYPMPQPQYRRLEEADWEQAWKAHYRPLRVGRRLLIRPLWIDVELAADDIEIALDPGMAFGTGTHPTTQLCLEALENLVQPGQDILDLGCGSGILAIAAAKLGAGKTLALDTDATAVQAARENAAVNGAADKITAMQGSLASIRGSAFDIVAVNILARVILALAENQLGAAVRPGGTAVFSGIIDTQAAEVEAALRRTGLRPYARRRRGDWMLIEAKR